MIAAATSVGRTYRLDTSDAEARQRAGDLFSAGVLRPGVFISHRYPLERYAEALAQFRAGVGRKIQVTAGG